MKLRYITPLATSPPPRQRSDWHRSPRPMPPCSRTRAMPNSLLLPGRPRNTPPNSSCPSAGIRARCYFTTITTDNGHALRAGKYFTPP